MSLLWIRAMAAGPHHDPVFGFPQGYGPHDPRNPEVRNQPFHTPPPEEHPEHEHYPAAHEGGEDFQWDTDSPHYRFFRGLDREDISPRTDELSEHLREDHPHWHLDSDLDHAWGTSNPRNTYLAMEEIHRRAHGRELGHRIYEPGTHDYMRLETAHRPWQEREEAERREEEEADREYRENGSAHMHGDTVSLGEMEHHLREQHGIPEEAMPEFERASSYHHDIYQQELEEAHERDHGEMGNYRHEPEESQYAEMHGEPLHVFDAEHHLVNRHGHDINELRAEEPSMDRLERMHNEGHDNDEGHGWESHHRHDPWDDEAGDVRRTYRLGDEDDDEDYEGEPDGTILPRYQSPLQHYRQPERHEFETHPESDEEWANPSEQHRPHDESAVEYDPTFGWRHRSMLIESEWHEPACGSRWCGAEKEHEHEGVRWTEHMCADCGRDGYSHRENLEDHAVEHRDDDDYDNSVPVIRDPEFSLQAPNERGMDTSTAYRAEPEDLGEHLQYDPVFGWRHKSMRRAATEELMMVS